MAQETIAQAVAFVRAFDQSGNIGNHKSAKVTHVHHSQIRLKRRERIVGDLRTRGGNPGDERRFARIWKTDQAHIREQFQFELQLKLFARTSLLVITRSAIGRCGKVRIAKSATAAARRDPAGAVLIKVEQKIIRARIKHLRSDRHAYDGVGSFAAGRLLPSPCSRGRHEFGVVEMVQERGERIVGDDHNVATAPAIAS